MKSKPHIVMVIPRGEAVRNFLYSDTLSILNENAKVTLLSIIDDEKFLLRFRPLVEDIIFLKQYNEHLLLQYLKGVILVAHFRWLWSGVAQNHWKTKNFYAKTKLAKLKWNFLKFISYLLAHKNTLKILTDLENKLSWILRPNDDFVDLFKKIKPDILFNTSQIHGASTDLLVNIAYKMKIPTAVFIFSWDNLTSRSRICAPYNYYFVWNKSMKNKLLSIYPHIKEERVFITGTPQFDFHFKKEFWLKREELCRRIGIDPNRPFILYTTSMDRDFPEEYRTLEFLIKTLKEIDISPKPQLVIRPYIKGINKEMRALAERNLADVIFSPMLWEEKWFFTPMFEDISLYTSLLRECSLGINAASTVSLELLMHDKPVINLAFDPPGSNLPTHLRWERHINYDHYRPVVESGAVMVARTPDDLKKMLIRGLREPQIDSQRRKDFIKNMFADTLDGNSGRRIAEEIIKLVSE